MCSRIASAIKEPEELLALHSTLERDRHTFVMRAAEWKASPSLAPSTPTTEYTSASRPNIDRIVGNGFQTGAHPRRIVSFNLTLFGTCPSGAPALPLRRA